MTAVKQAACSGDIKRPVAETSSGQRAVLFHLSGSGPRLWRMWWRQTSGDGDWPSGV